MTGSVAWTAVVPVKRFAAAKSRLDARTPALVRAFALDTVAAVVPAVETVVVVTDEPSLQADPDLPRGVRVLAQGAPGLDAAVAEGVAAATPGSGVLVLLGDLPALDTAAVSAVLREAASVRIALVPDADGRGTAMLTLAPGVRIETAFGAGSAARHVAAGAHPIDAPARARRDVDTAADLAAALALGVGPRTRQALGER